jgi:hypothetical protein
MEFLTNLIRVDQVYCLQLLYYLNKDQMQDSGANENKIQEVDPR